MLYVAADKYLKPNGKLGFVITQTIFKTEGGGDGFRRLKLGDGDPLRIIQVDDFSSIQCFEGATNRTAVVILQKGETTKFPLRLTTTGTSASRGKASQPKQTMMKRCSF